MYTQKINILRTMLVVSVFATAMAFLESAVVVYLREMYYPDGFDFPLQPIDFHIGVTEIIREFATLVMLLSIAYLSGKNLPQRFAWFLWTFAIWDLGYYLFLKLLIDWPSHWLTWDVLFLIPLTWVGPVIAPVLLSLVMLALAYAILYYNQSYRAVLIGREWLLLSLGSAVVLFSFMYEHIRVLAATWETARLLTEETLYHLSFVPEAFLWPVFLSGFTIICTGVVHFNIRQVKISKQLKQEQWF